MDARPRNLKDIFESQSRYLVPLFQRPYVWTKEKQWQPLWDDLQELAERHLKGDTRPHFMGAVVLEQLPSLTGMLDLRQIIDGQQRFTTLQIVIEAACDVTATLGRATRTPCRCCATWRATARARTTRTKCSKSGRPTWTASTSGA